MGARRVFDMVSKESDGNRGMAVGLCSCGALCVRRRRDSNTANVQRQSVHGLGICACCEQRRARQ
jgi:hypothetical protein